MKHLILLLTLASALTMSAAVNVDKGMADYVYPLNSPAAVEAPAFMPDGLTYLSYSPTEKAIVSVDTRTGKTLDKVLDLTHTRETTLESIQGFTLSPDGGKILVWTDRQMIYRRSFMAKYYVYEIRTRLLRPLSDEFEFQRAPLFSPDGRMVAFTASDNNIHIKKTDYNTEVAVTKDGAAGRIINGVPDWTYEEEFTATCSMAWAPDNLTLCFLKYNETDVPAYSFPLYQGTCNPRDEYALYPGSYTYKYPVAGQPNSVVTLHSYDVETRKVKNIAINDNSLEYIPRIAYAYDPSRLIVTTLNREQTRMRIWQVNPRSAVATAIFTEESEAWLPIASYENLTLRPDGFILLSARTGYTHLYDYTYAGSLRATITKGDFNVTDYYGSDAKGNHYFQSTRSGAINRVISSISPKGVITDITPAEGWATAQFTPAHNFAVITRSTANTVPVTTLCTPAGKSVRTIEDNASYAARYAGAPEKKFITVTTDEGVKLNGYVIMSEHFDPSARYPIIMNQYSGPGSQEVVNRWRMDWCQYFAKKGYVVVCVDPRGTGGRDRSFETAVYKRLGYLESIDLRSAARHFLSQPYADGRIGITGWSYGGYETLMAISSTDSPFKAAVAIAPVTSWRYYDTVYAERYMLTPGQNGDGYDQSAPVTLAGKMDTPLLIMHGTADDNVHLMNTLQYVSVLQSKGKMCDMFLYTDMNHSINGCDARLNVYSKMLDFFNKNL